MALQPGSRLGAYEIAARIGSGGMGEVYRARDTRLGRDVAIKILPDAFISDPERLARFRREAQLLATLNHQNIAGIYGLEENASGGALVLELVDGPTLADRIAQGPMPLDEALPIARQIAEALEAAHEHGVIHRDLKPANIKASFDGRVKVLDFGLAKALDRSDAVRHGSSADALSISPTITSPANTAVGVILGTAAYMSPEQAKGKSVDRRADIWAFGCVLYEMLTGKSAFAGDGASETLASVLRTDPDWRALPEAMPEPIGRLLRRCLAKDPRVRLSDAAVLRLEIDDAQALPSTPPVGGATRPSRRSTRLAWGVAVTSLLAAAATVALNSPTAPAAIAPIRFEIAAPPGTVFSGGERLAFNAISPDGRQVVFTTVETNGDTSLWIRRLDSVEARKLQGITRASYPFWSPDNRFVAFFAGGNLLRVDVGGGAPEVLCQAPGAIGGTWNTDGTILFGTFRSGLSRVSAGGGTPAAVTTLGAAGDEMSHRFPHFLPDGRHFLYRSHRRRTILVGSLDGTEPKPVTSSDSQAMYSPSGHLLLVRNGELMAQPFDIHTHELSGQPTTVARGLVAGTNSLVQFSVSSTGVLVYRATAGSELFRVAWMDRGGRSIERASGDAGDYRQIALSPDERYIAVSRRTVNGSLNIWLIDVARGVLSRFTAGDEMEDDFFWASDSRRLGFTRAQRTLVEKTLAGGNEKILLDRPAEAFGEDWSPDGRSIAFVSQGNISILPQSPTAQPFAFVESEFSKDEPHFSPDGRWVAYYSSESGRPEVYAQPFPGPGERVRLSTSGGSQPRWRADSRELFYLDLQGRIVAVPLQSGKTLEPGVPSVLFQTPIRDVSVNIDQYDVSRDGKRFVMIVPVAGAAEPRITVEVNWMAAHQP